MHKIYHIFFISITLTYASVVFAQTPYVSQNISLNQFFNPATVGFSGQNQFQLFYRNQFSGVGNPYKTIGFGMDFALFRNRDNEYMNQFGMGILGFSEQVLNGAMQSNQISVSLSNRIFLNGKKTSFLSLGISPTLLSRFVDRNAISFGDQYNSGRLFNPTSNEKLNNYPLLFSTNAGIQYTYTSENSFFQLGGSAYYVNRASGTQINWKTKAFQWTSSINFQKNIENISILLYANYQMREELDFLFWGGAIGFDLHSNENIRNTLYAGCFSRTGDALIPYLAIKFNKYKIGLSYDIYRNNMTSANLHPQTFEFTLTTGFGRKNWNVFNH